MLLLSGLNFVFCLELLIGCFVLIGMRADSVEGSGSFHKYELKRVSVGFEYIPTVRRNTRRENSVKNHLIVSVTL